MGLFRDVTERRMVEEEQRESKKQLQLHIDNSFDVIFTLNAEGVFTFLSDAWERHFGYPVNEVMGDNFIPFVHPDDVAPCLEYLQRVMDTMQPATSPTFRVRHADGSWRTFIVNGMPYFDNTGELLFNGVGHDITMRLLMEEKLRQSEEKYRTLYDSSADAIMMLDERGFFDCNKATLQMFGVSTQEEFVKFHPAQLSPPFQPDGVDSATAANGKIAEAMRRGTNFFEWVHQKANGEDFFADVMLTVLTIDGKQVLQAIVRDISERKLVENTLQQSVEKLRIVTSTAFDAIIMLNEDGNVTFWNGAAEKMFGYAEEEIIGRNLHMMLAPPAFREAHNKAFPHFQQTGQGAAVGRTVELAGLRKDRGEFPLELSLSSARSDGKWYSVGIVRDISRRKQAEKNLLDSEEKYRAMVEAIDSFMYVCSNNYRIEFMNDKLIKRTGRNATGEYCYKALHNLDSMCEWCVNERVFKGETVHWEIQSPKDDRWYEVNNSPIHRANGSISKQAIITDISERKSAEEKLSQAHQLIQKLNEDLELRVVELEKANGKYRAALLLAEAGTKARDEFLANTTHELVTPLNSVIGFSQVLLDELGGPLNDKQRRYVQAILQNGVRLNETYGDMLQIAGLGSGEMQIQLGRFRLKGLLESSIQHLGEKALTQGVTLSLEIGSLPETEIEADRAKLQQVLFNLLDNAVKFTPTGGSVQVSARRISDGDFIEISVTDTGIGVKEEDMGRLFKPFQQLESPYTKKYKGTGLGLLLAKKLVELHGGRIWAESEFGKGSTFSFVIPAGS